MVQGTVIIGPFFLLKILVNISFIVMIIAEQLKLILTT